MNLEGKSILITGANRGIGKSLIAEALEKGASTVYGTTRTAGKINFPNDKRVIELVMEVRDIKSIKKAKEKVSSLDVLINNAGVLHNVPILTSEDKLINAQEEIEVNYLGPLNVCNVFWPLLIKNKDNKNKGIIVNVMSTLAKVTYPFCGTYCASKHATLALTRGLRAQLKEHNVDVLEAYPGLTDTDMTEGLDHLPKVSPLKVAQKIMIAIESNETEVYVGDDSIEMAQQILKDPEAAQTEANQYMPDPLKAN